VDVEVRVQVGVRVMELVRLGEGVKVSVQVRLKVGLRVAVREAVGELVRVGVRLGVVVRVRVVVTVKVEEREAVREGVKLGVRVAVRVALAEGLAVYVRLGVMWRSTWAVFSLERWMSLGEQFWPVVIQAMLLSLGGRSCGMEGGPTGSVPLSPPRGTLTCWPAPKYCSWPLATMRPEPLYILTIISWLL
jgi:hypothetical protein